jgi:hypothetical protein
MDDLYLLGYGFVRGFLSGILSRLGIVVSDVTLDFLAVLLGHYLKNQGGWKGVLGRVMFVGGLVSLGIEIGQTTGRRMADEIFSALPIGGAQAGATASPQYQLAWRQPGVGGIVF